MQGCCLVWVCSRDMPFPGGSIVGLGCQGPLGELLPQRPGDVPRVTRHHLLTFMVGLTPYRGE